MTRVGRQLTTGALVAGMALAVAADDTADLKKELEALKAKVQALEAKPATAGVVPVAAPQAVAKDPMPTPQAPPGPGAGDSAGKTLEWVKDIKVYGFVDVGYTYNFMNPGNHLNGRFGSATTNLGVAPGTAGGSARAFDQRANSFVVNNVQIDLERAATWSPSKSNDSIVGFKAEFTTGRDATVLSGTEAWPSGVDQFEVQEAYIQFIVPVGNGIDIRAGKMATLSGYEVIERKDDMNYSGSYLFTFAIPFTHTGIRASYQIIDPVKVTLGVNNGWNFVDDNNEAKTLEFQLALTPTIWDKQWLQFYTTIYWGTERTPSVGVISPLAATSTGDHRFLMDYVLNLTPVENWTFGLNFDWGVDQNAIGASTDAKWRGEAIYVKYQLWDWYAIALRSELFSDQNGYTTSGFSAAAGIPAGPKQKLWEFTMTHEFKIAERVIVRLEYRHDKSDKNTFLEDLTPKSTQDTIAMEAIFPF